jgi:mercuric ion transport protein
MKEAAEGRSALFAGGLAAILASLCCLGPLVLLTLGFSGAWISNLTLFQPYQPVFIGAALVALYFAGRRIYPPPAKCAPGEVCAVPQVRSAYKIVLGLVAALIVRGPRLSRRCPLVLLIGGSP